MRGEEQFIAAFFLLEHVFFFLLVLKKGKMEDFEEDNFCERLC